RPGGSGRGAAAGGGELLFLGGAGQGRQRGQAAVDHAVQGVEIAGADFALVLGGGVAVLLGGELRLLQLHVGGHLPCLVAARQFEHGVVERVEAGQGDELEPVAHGRELPLEAGDGGV